MKHTFYYLALVLIILSCSNNKKETKIKSETISSSSAISETLKNKYAVTWRWTTKNEELVTANSETISKELTALWKNDIIENAYNNSGNS